MDQAFEIRMKNGKSYFFNVYSISNLKSLLKHLNNIGTLSRKIIDARTMFPKMKFTKKWKKGKISSYQYILLLNKFSSRSFNDINQYYVFPWVLNKYSAFFNINTKTLTENNQNKQNESTSNDDNKNISVHFRDFKYPISVQSDKAKEKALSKFEASKLYTDDNFNKKEWFFHFGSHYSTSGFILYYNLRQYPFTSELVKFQSNAQENSNRMFFSLYETQNVINSIFDSRELIPEFFSHIEFMLNLNCVFFGHKTNGELVDDVNLPEFKPSSSQTTLNQSTISSYYSFNNYIDFIVKHRLMLNNTLLSNHLALWFNNIFGEGQFYDSETKNKNSCNLYNKTSYEEKTNLQRKLDKYKKKGKYTEEEIISKLESKSVLILNFGQTPIRLFKTPHTNIKVKSSSMTDEEMKCYINNNKILIKPQKKNFITYPIYFYVNENNSKCLLLTNTKSIIIYNIYTKKDKQHKEREISLLKQHFDNKKIDYNIDGGNTSSDNEKEIKNDINNDDKKVNPKHKFTHICDIPSSDMKLFTSNIDQYKYNPKYSVIALYNFTHIITCRHKDYLLHIYTIPSNPGSNMKSTLSLLVLNHFTYSLCKFTETKFLCGLSSGQLLLFKHNSNKKGTYESITSFHDHNAPIITIDINKRLNIIITSSLDGNIHIRKSFDFELLTVINYNNTNLIPLQIAITTCNFIYILYTDKMCLNTLNNKIIYGYTLNGLFFGKSSYSNYIGLEPNERGEIYTGICDKFILCNVNGSLKPSMDKFELAMFKGDQKAKCEKLKWFKYDVQGNQRFLYYLNSIGELQLIEECYLKEFEFFK